MVVEVGETVRLPLPMLTGPIPLSIEAETALLVDQERVELCPEFILAGEALMLTVGGLDVEPPDPELVPELSPEVGVELPPPLAAPPQLVSVTASRQHRIVTQRTLLFTVILQAGNNRRC